MKVCLECLSKFENLNWVCPSCGFQPSKLDGLYIHSPEHAEDGDGGFKEDSFSNLYELEKKNFWFCSRNKLISWALKKYKGNLNNFLEIGCGTGFVLNRLSKTFPQISLLGSEIFLNGLSFAKTRIPDGNFMQMDARKIPFIDEFDAIGAFDVLEHIKEDELVLKQIYSALKPSGILLISVPQHPFLWSKSDEYACHFRRYTNDNLVRLVRKSGFQIIKNTSFVFTLIPFMYFSRRRNLYKKRYNPSEEFQISKFMNFIFYLILYFEFICITIGISFPFGGSRFIVASKRL